MSEQQENPHEEKARILKAIQLADYIDGHAPLDDDYLSGLRLMPKVWWKQIAEHAGCKTPPSEKTIGVVISTLRNRLAARKAAPADPFEGLPDVGGASPDPSSVQMRGCANV